MSIASRRAFRRGGRAADGLSLDGAGRGGGDRPRRPDRPAGAPAEPYASSVEDWPRLRGRTWSTEYRWLREPDVAAWVAGSRLNLLRDLPEHVGEPAVQIALQRYVAHVGTAIGRLKELGGSATRSAAPS
jgi:hypothetical protein